MSDRVSREHWLHIAKSLAVGQVARVPHPGDRTDRHNLIIYNTPEKWSCWCMSCKEGAGLKKEHVRFELSEPADSKVPTLPNDLRPVYTLPDWELRNIAHFLARKGMDLSYFPDELFYSKSRERILITTPQGMAGRDITEKSQAKWIIYTPAHYLGWPSQLRTVVVVEDTFSMFKVDYALRLTGESENYTVVCSLGTGVAPQLMTNLMLAKQVVFMYDGDKPGWDGAKSQSKRVRALGVPSVEACAKAGNDPKDLPLLDIINHLQEATVGFSHFERVE